MRRRCLGGFHLMELLIAMMIMTALLTISSRFLVTSFKLSAEGSVQASMQNQAVLAMHKMLLDLQRTNAAGLTLHPEGFGVIRMTTLTSLRTLVWETRQIIYYRDAETKKVYSKWWPPQPPVPAALEVSFDASQPPHITEDMFTDIIHVTNGTERLLASDVLSLTLTPENGIESMALKMELGVQIRGEMEIFELTRIVGLRNHL